MSGSPRILLIFAPLSCIDHSTHGILFSLIMDASAPFVNH